MNDKELLQWAQEAGFNAAIIPTKDIPVNGVFRKYCEENYCGKYNANYSCPPGCGSVEEVYRHLFSTDKALVLQTIHDIKSYEDKDIISKAKEDLNAFIHQLTERFRDNGINCFGLGYGGCSLCNPCKQVEGKPCVFPQKRLSCMSAYCIDVEKLAEHCGLEFAWIPEKLFLFGMIAIKEKI